MASLALLSRLGISAGRELSFLGISTGRELSALGISAGRELSALGVSAGRELSSLGLGSDCVSPDAASLPTIHSKHLQLLKEKHLAKRQFSFTRVDQ